MFETMDQNETRMIYMCMSVLGCSIVAIIFLLFGYTIIFYILAIITVIVGYYFARSMPRSGEQTPKRKR